MKREESGNPETKKFQIPLEVTPENKEMLLASGYTKEDFIIRFIANRRCRVVLVDVSEDVYHEYMRAEWREAKRRARECGRIMLCPGSNISGLVDNPESVAYGLEDDVLAMLAAEDIYDMLFEIDARYAQIFCMRYEGATHQEIAEELGMNRRTVCEYDKRIRQIIQKHIEDFFE